MLIATIAMLILAIDASNSAKYSSEIAQESLNSIKDSNNLTMKTVKWYYEPQPQMNLWISEDYELNKSGVILIDEWNGYIDGNGFNVKEGAYISLYSRFGNNSGYYEAPSYLACCKSIKIFVYNSGRGSIIFPLLSIDLKNKNKTDGALFKIHTVRTPIDKLEYDPIKKYMFESQEFIQNQQIWMPYGNKGDFPPYLDENGDAYFVPPGFSEKYTDGGKYFDRFWDKRSNVLGPFSIGTIPPGETAEIELKIFSAKGWHSMMKDWSDSKEKEFTFPPKAYETCKEGFLNITVQSLNTETMNRSIKLRTGTKTICYNYTAELEEKWIAARR